MSKLQTVLNWAVAAMASAVAAAFVLTFLGLVGLNQASRPAAETVERAAIPSRVAEAAEPPRFPGGPLVE